MKYTGKVFCLDPISNFNSTPTPGCQFYELGLQGVGSDISPTHSVQYDAIDPLLHFVHWMKLFTC